jgi:Cof subfamily protein (haloacid dehalogenase superfamily)
VNARCRLLALDIDGTLLTSDRQIHQAHMEAVKRAISGGITVVLASGRSLPSMRPFLDQLELRGGPAIAANGAHVVGPGEVDIAVERLAVHERLTIIEFAEERSLHLNAYSTDKLYFHHESEWGEMYMRRVKSVLPTPCTTAEFRTLSAVKLMLVGDPVRLQHERALIGQRLDATKVAMTFSEPEYLEFLPGGIDKGWGLRVLAEHLGIAQAEAAAAGDFHNDLEMLAWAGMSAAMATAPDEVKAVATMVVPGSDEGGLAIFIESLLDRDCEAV